MQRTTYPVPTLWDKLRLELGLIRSILGLLIRVVRTPHVFVPLTCPEIGGVR